MAPGLPFFPCRTVSTTGACTPYSVRLLPFAIVTFINSLLPLLDMPVVMGVNSLLGCLLLASDSMESFLYMIRGLNTPKQDFRPTARYDASLRQILVGRTPRRECGSRCRPVLPGTFKGRRLDQAASPNRIKLSPLLAICAPDRVA